MVAGIETNYTKNVKIKPRPIFSNYINTGLTMISKERLKNNKKFSFINKLIFSVTSNEILTSLGQWPPEQWLWNAIFESNKELIAFYDRGIHCNCATGFNNEICKYVLHYCNEKGNLGNSAQHFTHKIIKSHETIRKYSKMLKNE